MQEQGPASNCIINNKLLGWLSCSAYGMAMGIDRATLGAKRPSGCEVRRRTGDTTGGLTLPQVAAVAEVAYGVDVDVRVGSNVCTPSFAARRARAGRGFCLQGNTGPLVKTRWKSTNGGVNHLVWVNEVRGGTADVPDEALVYDPAADGRRSDIDQGPSWWPWSLVLRFAAALRPWGEDDPRVLGPGKFYAGFLPDTEPHVHLKYGGVRTVPFPDRTTAYNVVSTRLINVRAKPTTSSTKVDTLKVGERFTAYQKTTSGQLLAGSRVWYGNHNGNEWVHESGLRGEGGTS